MAKNTSTKFPTTKSSTSDARNFILGSGASAKALIDPGQVLDRCYLIEHSLRYGDFFHYQADDGCVALVHALVQLHDRVLVMSDSVASAVP